MGLTVALESLLTNNATMVIVVAAAIVVTKDLLPKAKNT